MIFELLECLAAGPLCDFCRTRRKGTYECSEAWKGKITASSCARC